jgi:zinc transporter, ZIP family
VAPETAGFLLAAGAAATTMLGWAIVAAKRSWTPRSVGIALLVAGIAMVGVSVAELLPPGLRDPQLRLATALLFAAGALAVPLLRRALAHLFPGLGALHSASLLVMVSIALHNVPEGTVAFAATLVSLELGVVTAVAIALHNIPEGMAVATAVIAAGGSRRRALAATSLAMLGELLGAVLILALDAGLSPQGAVGLLALVGGVMISVSLTQLIPTGIALVRSGGRLALADGEPITSPATDPVPDR